jgi:oligogalacturonide lyase
VVRLSSEPGSASLYFHQNPYTARGDKQVISTPRGLATIDLNTRAVTPLVSGRVSHLVVAPRSRQAYYIQNGVVYGVDLDTRAVRTIRTDSRLRSGSGFGLSADEETLAGSYVEGDVPATQPPQPSPAAGTPANPLATPPPRESSLEARWAARLPMALYTLRVKTGELKVVYRSNDWLNHVQMSPTDPTLIMYCHEGPWHKVDRIWTIRTDGSNRRLMHARTMDMEIAGHEFFSQDGKTIWYDLQTPKYKVFWLAGVEIAFDKTTRYPLAREHWSVHFNQSPDGSLFAGDGGGPNSVAAPGNGQWIYLYRPMKGSLDVERLVDLSKHDYQLEPNVTFTRDGKWITFRSNMHGASHVYAVEVARGPQQSRPDFSGNWTLTSPIDAPASIARELIVRQWVERRTSVKGVPVESIHVTIQRQSKTGLRSDSYEIGLQGGIVGGVEPTGRGSGPLGESPQTRFSTTWDNHRLVIETSGYSGSSRESGPYSARKEVWSLDTDDVLVLRVSEAFSGAEPVATTLTYRRR